MPRRNIDEPLACSILSLLVAADQCCPTIIGQAHLLYYAGAATDPEHVAKIFSQLKRDADDLLQAIADVEVALNQADVNPARPAERDGAETAPR